MGPEHPPPSFHLSVPRPPCPRRSRPKIHLSPLSASPTAGSSRPHPQLPRSSKPHRAAGRIAEPPPTRQHRLELFSRCSLPSSSSPFLLDKYRRRGSMRTRHLYFVSLVKSSFRFSFSHFLFCEQSVPCLCFRDGFVHCFLRAFPSFLRAWWSFFFLFRVELAPDPHCMFPIFCRGWRCR